MLLSVAEQITDFFLKIAVVSQQVIKMVTSTIQTKNHPYFDYGSQFQLIGGKNTQVTYCIPVL